MASFQINGGTFRWTDKKDVLLLREVREVQPFLYKSGTPESGQKWSCIASNLNVHPQFHDAPRDQRSVRERFNKIYSNFKSKLNKEEKASGINPPPPTEAEVLFEEIKELMESYIPSSSTSVKAENDRKKALKIRDPAMNTLGKGKKSVDDEEEDEKPTRKRSRRSSADPLEYLASKKEADLDLRKEELELRRTQLELESKKLEAEARRQSQMQDQIAMQNQQMQQQMQMMMAILQHNMNNH